MNDSQILKELNSIKLIMSDIIRRVDNNSVNMHNASTSDITDIQEAVSDIMYNQINDEILN
jgi:hypothetical protein